MQDKNFTKMSIPDADLLPDTTGYGQQADGTHPIGMLSC